MMERNLHKDALIVTKDTDVVHLMQYENNYTKLIIDNLEIEEGYDYFVVFKKDHDCVVYEMPIETNEIPLGAYITNQIGVYYFDIVYRNDSIDQVVIGSPFRIIVEKGIYNQPTSEVNFPEPIQSKYQDLINLINEVRYDLDNDVFKGDKGDAGNGIDHITFQNYSLTFHMTDGTQFTTPSIRGEKGDAYTITEADYEAIGDIVTEREQSRFNQYVETKKTEFNEHATAKQNAFDSHVTTKTTEFDTHAEAKADQEIARINADQIVQDVEKLKDEKMETYRVEVWDIDTPNARFLHIKQDGTSERVYYADLIEKYADPRYFLYCEYVTFGVTLIPSLPPLDYDQILEFTSNWEYGGVVHQSRVIVNSNNEIKFDDREIAQKNDIKVDDVKVNGTSVVTNKIANIDTASMESDIADLIAENKAQAKQIEADQRRITNLEYASKGILYYEEASEDEAYSKNVDANALPYASFDKLGGKTEVANQICNFSIYSYAGVTFVLEGNVYRLSGTCTQSGQISATNIKAINGHKYYAKYKYTNFPVNDSGTAVFQIYDQSNAIIYANAEDRVLSGTSGEVNFIYTARADSTRVNIRFRIQTGLVYDNMTLKKVPVVDLTQRYGAGNEPTTTDDPRIKLLDMELEANGEYNEGSLVSAEVQNVVSSGANLWNEQTQLGWYNIVNGVFENVTDRICCVNPIKVEPNVRYKMVSKNGLASAVNAYACWYDEKDNFVGYTPPATNYALVSSSGALSPTNARYMRFYFNAEYGTTYKNDIAIIKGTSGTYTPYFESTKPLSSIISKYFPNGMHSAGSVYDEFDIDRGVAINNIFVSKLKDLIWLKRKYDGNYYFIAKANSQFTLNSQQIGIIFNVNTYISEEVNSLPNNNGITFNSTYSGGGIRIVIRDDNTSTVQALIDKFKDDELIYVNQLEPIETPIDQADIEALRSLQVEAGGSITFENAQFLQVPNKESYLVKVV